jgi:hypothetical protein
MRKKLMIIAFAIANAPLHTSYAADLIFDPALNACTTLNCNAVILNGISLKSSFGDSISYTSQVFAGAGECIRLDVFSESADMKMVLVSPSGTVWRNDDRSPGSDLRPLITAQADVKGYYTVQINFWNGNQATNTLQFFSLAYGRYVVGTSTNCPSVISPFARQSSEPVSK